MGERRYRLFAEGPDRSVGIVIISFFGAEKCPKRLVDTIGDRYKKGITYDN